MSVSFKRWSLKGRSSSPPLLEGRKRFAAWRVTRIILLSESTGRVGGLRTNLGCGREDILTQTQDMTRDESDCIGLVLKESDFSKVRWDWPNASVWILSQRALFFQNTDGPWRQNNPVISTSFVSCFKFLSCTHTFWHLVSAAVRNLAMKQTGNIVSLNGREPWSFVLRLERSILECWHMIQATQSRYRSLFVESEWIWPFWFIYQLTLTLKCHPIIFNKFGSFLEVLFRAVGKSGLAWIERLGNPTLWEPQQKNCRSFSGTTPVYSPTSNQVFWKQWPKITVSLCTFFHFVSIISSLWTGSIALWEAFDSERGAAVFSMSLGNCWRVGQKSCRPLLGTSGVWVPAVWLEQVRVSPCITPSWISTQNWWTQFFSNILNENLELSTTIRKVLNRFCEWRGWCHSKNSANLQRLLLLIAGSPVPLRGARGTYRVLHWVCLVFNWGIIKSLQTRVWKCSTCFNFPKYGHTALK